MNQEWLKTFSGIAILSAIVFTPFGYGGNVPWGRNIIIALGAAAFVSWIPVLILRRRMSSVPLISLLSLILLLLIGWLMTLNAKSLHDFDFWSYTPITQSFTGLPGSVDATTSKNLMIQISAMLGVFIVSCELCGQRQWIARLITTMAVIGTATAAFGIYQKISKDPLPIWPVPHPPQNVFATFWYHGNAASFLNIIWPLLAGLSMLSFQKGSNQVLRAFWLSSLVVVLVGLLLNVSKAGHVIAAILIGLYLVMLFQRMPDILARHGWREPLALAILAIGGLGAVLLCLDWNQALGRWHEFLARSTGDSRRAVAVICMGLVAESGWFGFGPGAFDAVFQHHAADLGFKMGVRWKNAHNDYLQTWIEWGHAGTALWIGFWFTPVKVAIIHIFDGVFKRFRSRSDRRNNKFRLNRHGLISQDPLKIGASLSLIGVLIHASYDFPLQIPGIQLYVVVLAGILAANPLRTKTHLDHRFVPPEPSQSY